MPTPVLKPEDRVAVKPHAGPAFHAIQYLLGRQSREKLMNFRGYKGAQSYPSRTKDGEMVDFSTGSVGLGVAQTLFASMVQDYVHAHGWAKNRSDGRTVMRANLFLELQAAAPRLLRLGRLGIIAPLPFRPHSSSRRRTSCADQCPV